MGEWLLSRRGQADSVARHEVPGADRHSACSVGGVIAACEPAYAMGDALG